MRYRQHRGGLDESLDTTVDVDGLAGIYAHEDKQPLRYPNLTIEGLSTLPYGGDDPRCEWKDVHMVLLDGRCIGFCEGPTK